MMVSLIATNGDDIDEGRHIQHHGHSAALSRYSKKKEKQSHTEFTRQVGLIQVQEVGTTERRKVGIRLLFANREGYLHKRALLT